MARVARIRSKVNVSIGRYRQITSSGFGSWQTVIRNYTSTITDSHGRPVVPSPLSSQQYDGGDCWANGYFKKPSGTIQGYEFENMPVNHNAGEVDDFSVPAIPSGWELSAVARSNPSRPVLFPPEVVQDIVSLPKMIKNLWSLLKNPKSKFSPKGVSNEYLGLQFGWLPIIEDLEKISKLQEYINRRAQWAQDLYSNKKGLRRKIRFSKDTKTYRKYLQFNTDWGNVQFPGSVTVTKEVWATVRWKPVGPIPPALLDGTHNEYLRNMVLGLTPEGMVTGIWKILPWTWMIGWFTNAADLLLVRSGTLPAQYTEACLMRKVTWVRHSGLPVFTGSGFSSSLTQTGLQTWTSRSRNVGTGNLLPSVNMPFLDMFRLSIVGALAIQRIR